MWYAIYAEINSKNLFRLKNQYDKKLNLYILEIGRFVVISFKIFQVLPVLNL